MTSIGEDAFYGCSGLTSVTIPESVTSIGETAFYGCSNLRSVTIGSGVTSIGRYAFYGCSNHVKTIWMTNTPPSDYSEASGSINYVANDNYSLSNMVVYPFLSSIFEVDGVKYVPVSPSERTCDAIDCTYDESVTDITIDSKVSFKGIAMNVKEVMPYTLYKNGVVKSVKVVNDGSIGYNAFYDCDSLTTATIANNGNIGSSAFYDCGNLSSATIECVGAISSSAFKECVKLSSVELGDRIKSLEDYAFSGCSSLVGVELTDSIAKIGKYAFNSCSSLAEMSVPQSVESIGDYAFDNCTSLAKFDIEDRTTTLKLGSNGSSAFFSDCPLKSVYIGGKISYSTSSSYGYSPFYRNTSLETVVITDEEV